MNTLPPARAGVSSCSINCRTRALARRIVGANQDAVRARIGDEHDPLLRFGLRAGLSGVSRSVSSRLTSATTSSAEAFFTGTSIGSPAGGWSSDATIRSIRRRLSA